MNNQNTPEKYGFEIFRMPKVEVTVGLKKSAIRKLISEGKFPAPKKIMPGALNGPSGWSADEVYAWARARMEGD